MLSESVADYLSEILRLEESGEAAPASVLAERLHVSRPSVTGMLRRLAQDGLVNYAPYSAVSLTASGRRSARDILRRHRLVETFLVNVLDMPAAQVHDEAHRWEHALSDDAVDRLDRWLGRPAEDPHGTPIPRGGRRRVQTSLADLATGTDARITDVSARDGDHAAYLSSLGLVVGARVSINERRPFGGPVTLEVDGRCWTVGSEVTTHVTIDREECP